MHLPTFIDTNIQAAVGILTKFPERQHNSGYRGTRIDFENDSHCGLQTAPLGYTAWPQTHIVRQ
jgi:hypothetical protein